RSAPRPVPWRRPCRGACRARRCCRQSPARPRPSRWSVRLRLQHRRGAIVLVIWTRRPPASMLPAEPFRVALRAGLRYATQASVLQSVLIKAASFFTFASALTALLPIVVNRELQASAGTYGLLPACCWAASALARSPARCCCRDCARLDPDR